MLAMDNSDKQDNNDSKFFISTEKNLFWLNQKRVVFGEVIRGRNALDIM